MIVHDSQSPAEVQAELVACLRRKRVNHKFLYSSPSQTEKWLRLHSAYSPSRTETGCEASYDQGFLAVATKFRGLSMHFVSLGCGGGQKDARLLAMLASAGAKSSYSPIDVSHSMVSAASRSFQSTFPGQHCYPVVCDLGMVRNFRTLVPAGEKGPWLITFFGMIPNFEPSSIIPKLANLLRDPADALLFSANLAPPPDYELGVRKILPLYDNELTREWLLGFLSEVGIQSTDGKLEVSIETAPETGLKRIAYYFTFNRSLSVTIGTDVIGFEAGSRLLVFFSYRHTCESIKRLLAGHKLRVTDSWLAPSKEEGVFMVNCDELRSTADPKTGA